MHSSSSNVSARGTPSRRGKSPRLRGDSPPQPGTSFHPQARDNKRLPTFTSSLSIKVEGAISIDGDALAHQIPPSALPDQPHLATSESKRAPRKSKTEAMVALNNRARSSSPDDFNKPHDLTEKYLTAPPIPVSPALDMSSVKTVSPRNLQTHNTSPRPFGLRDCPTYTPTLEEFKDPMAYIRIIAEEASDHGICKIIPPEGWKMPFVTDTERFRFRTRVQRLNSIEATARAKLNFLEQLYRFHKQQGNPRVAVPTINHKPLDLWLLRKEVHKMGGYDAVTKGKKWSDVGRLLGYRGIPGLSTQVKNSYTRVILPYEHFCERARNSPAISSTSRDPQARVQDGSRSPEKLSRINTSVTADGDSPPSSPLSALSDPEEGESKGIDGFKSASSRPRRSTRMGLQEPLTPASKKLLPVTTPVVPPPTFHDKPESRDIGESCEICHKTNKADEMLLCDGCDCGFHMFCLDPPLDAIPKDQWFCFTCLSGTGGDFGFDEGEEHSLSSFQARDQEFRRLWFEAHPPADDKMSIGPDGPDPFVNTFGNVQVSEHDVEREFWRLVQDPNETVEIEYGADVHSTFHGSAMPTMETHPLDSYSRDPWNLNNIPIVHDSLLRFIKSDISGMTVPWTYVGMVFSTFCWHNEDHYTYSINFMHWGETKTWYGIPGVDAEKFETAIKSEAPDLFQAQPDLLFQLVTLMNPERISEAGVRVYACNQRAGEFVITFPKAYHAGFNHGLNFNEAVNFALPDWLPLGLQCVQRYREHRKLPVFSHDELLITITQHSQAINTAIWLSDSLKEMTEREKNDRKKARSFGFLEVLEEVDRPEDQYQCTVCKVFCYLSQITCPCSTKVVCVEHHHLLCEVPGSHSLVLRKRFSDEELQERLMKISERAGVPGAWRTKFNKLLTENAKPPLKSLRALLAEGERLNYHFLEMVPLRKCVERASEWLEGANQFLIRKQSRNRSRRRGRPSTGEGPSDDPGDRPDKGLDELYALIREVEDLGFDCPEIAALQQRATTAEEIKSKANQLLQDPSQEKFLQKCQHLLMEASKLNVVLDELFAIESVVERQELIRDLEDVNPSDPDTSLTLSDVRQLLARAKACNLQDDNPHYQALKTLEHSGETWEQRAQAILGRSIKTIEDLNSLDDVEPPVTVNPTILQRWNSARAKANDFDMHAKRWLEPEPNAIKPRVAEMLKMLSRAEKDFDIPSVKRLKKLAEKADALETKSEQVLKGRYGDATNNVDFNQLEEILSWRELASEVPTISLPNWERVDQQLTEHTAWLRELPWYNTENYRAEGEAILRDVVDCSNPDDDLPPNDEFFTCICHNPVRPPPTGQASDAVQCDHCGARFHGECANNGGSCPFCDHHHWNGSIPKKRNWHFGVLYHVLARASEITRRYSPDFKELEIIVHRVDRLMSVIGQFLTFTSQAVNQRPEYIHQARHYMRKLYSMQFAVSPSSDISFGLDLAGLHRMLATRPPTRTRKRRRPRFVFGQDKEGDWTDGTRCICRGRTSYLLGYPKVACETCKRYYHSGCVFYPEYAPTERHPFICPLCCLRKGQPYPYSDVRVKTDDHTLGADIYVDTETMVRTFSGEILYRKIPPPTSPTLFVELVEFLPGQPEGSTTSHRTRTVSAVHPHHQMHVTTAPIPLHLPAHPHPYPSARGYAAPHPILPNLAYPHPIHSAGPTTVHYQSQTSSPSGPWSRWGAMTTPARPPSTQRRQTSEGARTTPQPLPSTSAVPPMEQSPPSISTTLTSVSNGIQGKKRKHPEELSPIDRGDDSRRNTTAPPSPKRGRNIPAPTTPMQPPSGGSSSNGSSGRAVQSLSPSLAMIVSPVNQGSPRAAYLTPPSIRNGDVQGSPSSIHSVQQVLISQSNQ